MYYNEAGSIQGLSGDDWGELTVSSGLTSETVTSVVEDQNGNLWVGTDVGITIVSEPGYPLTQNTLVFLGAVRDQFINTIVVDPLNNKWIGTQTGVDYVSADGSTLLGQYTTQNTNGKLVDNNVLSIALDQKRGIAYFGTGKGLSSLEIPPIATVEQMGSLVIGPNPYVIPNVNSFTIKGLADNATIKILNVSGSLVKEFSAQGAGRAFWDGTDGNGKIVGSGIYIVVAYADNGNQVATAKLAVIRR
jgi:ligand-binding sensor domain-containing protein